MACQVDCDDLNAQEYDCVVIGAGAAGSMAAWNLTSYGARVLLLDAGKEVLRERAWSNVSRADEAYGTHSRDRSSIYLSTREQPYCSHPERPFALKRVWARGGKTLVWGRIALRFSDRDFIEPSIDGWGMPWPIRYVDVRPYYDKLDRLLSVQGGSDDSDILPGSQYHLPPETPTPGQMLLSNAARNLGMPMVSARRASNASDGSNFTAVNGLLGPALATRRLTIVDNAVVGRILVDDDGLASAIQYFDRYTKAELKVRARVVVLAASCIDSTRILLNSKSHRYPNGLANTNDIVGRYLSEHMRFHMFGFLPQLMGKTPERYDPGGTDKVYIPRFNHRQKPKYLRGYGMQFWGCSPGRNASFAKSLPGFGASFKAAVRERFPALVAVHPYGEVLPRRDNRVTVDDRMCDQYGIPVPSIDFSLGANESAMISEMYDSAEALLRKARAEVIRFKRQSVDISGSAVHELGTCRMGVDPVSSVVNRFCQSHEVPNLFVVDGSVFPSATEKNPTFTILALAWRATDYLMAELRSGRLRRNSRVVSGFGRGGKRRGVLG